MTRLLQPMKAPNQSLTELDLRLLQYPVYVSPKLDGLRAMGVAKGLRSRTMRPFDNAWLNRFFDHWRLDGLDGELVVGDPFGDDLIRRCGALRRVEGEPDAHWWLFDSWLDPELPYEVRLKVLSARLLSVPAKIRSRLHVVEQTLCQCADDVLRVEQEALAQGYEGLMVRSIDGQYKFGRATWREGLIFKFKRFVDAEARITGFEEGEHNLNEAERKADGSIKRSTKKAGMAKSGTIGTLLGVDLKTGKPVRINPAKMKHDERDYWFQHPDELAKKVCTYRRFEGGTVDKPRFPTWQCWRDKADR